MIIPKKWHFIAIRSVRFAYRQKKPQKTGLTQNDMTKTKGLESLRFIQL